MRFELTGPFGPSVFKTGAINRTLPHFHIGTHFGYCTKQKLSTTVETAEMCFYMAPEIRIELILRTSKAPVLPLHHSGIINSTNF